MKKLLLLFIVLFVVLLGCEQSTGGSEAIPTEGFIDGKAWEIFSREYKFFEDDGLKPVLVYAIKGANDKIYYFSVGKPAGLYGKYMFQVQIAKKSKFNETYDRMEVGNLWYAVPNTEESIIGSTSDTPNTNGFYQYIINMSVDTIQTLINETGNVPIRIKNNEVTKEEFIVASNFQKLLKTFDFDNFSAASVQNFQQTFNFDATSAANAQELQQIFDFEVAPVFGVMNAELFVD